MLLSDTTLGFTSFTKQENVVTGSYYEFKVSAVNDISESVLSSKIRVIAASFPDPPINL